MNERIVTPIEEFGRKLIVTGDLDPLDEDSERCIVVARPTTADPGKE